MENLAYLDKSGDEDSKPKFYPGRSTLIELPIGDFTLKFTTIGIGYIHVDLISNNSFLNGGHLYCETKVGDWGLTEKKDDHAKKTYYYMDEDPNRFRMLFSTLMKERFRWIARDVFDKIWEGLNQLDFSFSFNGLPHEYRKPFWMKARNGFLSFNEGGYWEYRDLFGNLEGLLSCKKGCWDIEFLSMKDWRWGLRWQLLAIVLMIETPSWSEKIEEVLKEFTDMNKEIQEDGKASHITYLSKKKDWNALLQFMEYL